MDVRSTIEHSPYFYFLPIFQPDNYSPFTQLTITMRGLMMEYQLTLPTILRRAEALFGKKEIVTRLPDKSVHRYTYRDFALRAKKLAVALQAAWRQ
jgi:hypothetical protein